MQYRNKETLISFTNIPDTITISGMSVCIWITSNNSSCVGNPAPPAPTIPLSCMISVKLSIYNTSFYLTDSPPTSTHLLILANDLAEVSPSPVGPAIVNVVYPSPPTPMPA